MPLTAGELALLNSQRMTIHWYALLENQEGVYQDYGDYLGQDWRESVEWGASADEPIADITLELARQIGTESLAPLVSSFSNTGGPAIDGGRGIQIQYAVTPVGTAPLLIDRHLAFDGRTSKVSWGGRDGNLQVHGADKAHRLTTTIITEKITYGSEEGTSAEEVMQQILDDWLPGQFTLWAPEPTAYNVTSYIPYEVSVWEALRTLTLKFGYGLGMRWRDSISAFALTTWKPVIEDPEPVASIGPDQYTDVPEIGRDTANVRNRVRVRFDNGGTPDVVEVRDQDSIDAYGDQFIQYTEDQASTIDTPEEAADFANYILRDLATPDIGLRALNLFWPAVELGDYVEFLPNDELHSEAQIWAVLAYRHRLDRTDSETTITTKGKAVTAYRDWLNRGSSGIPSTVEVPYEDLLYLPEFREVGRDNDGVYFTWGENTNLYQVWVFRKVLLQPTTVEPWPSDSDPNVMTHLWQRLDPNEVETNAQGIDYKLFVPYPAQGYISYVQVEGRDPSYITGDVEQIEVLPVQESPVFAKAKQVIGTSGLYTDFSIEIVDPQGKGGRLTAWLNHGSTADPDPNGAADGYIDIAVTPITIDITRTWSTGTALFDNIRVHPGSGKVLTLEFVNAEGTSTGKQEFVITPKKTVVDDVGEIVNNAINTHLQFASNLSPVVLAASLASVPATAQIAAVDGTLYRRQGDGTLSAAVPTVQLTGQVIAAQIADAAITTAKFAAGIEPVSVSTAGTLPTTKTTEVVYWSSKLYRWNGSAYVASVPTVDLVGTIVEAQIADSAISTAKFAAGIQPVGISTAGSLPTTKTTEVIYWQSKVYRWNGSAYTAAVPTVDLTGTVATAQIADAAITAAKIGALAVQTANMAVGAVTADILAAGAVTETKITNDAVTTAKIVAGAITTGKIAAGAVTANEIAALAITTAKLAAGAVTADTIAAGAVTAGKIAALSITAGDIASSAITTTKLAAGAVTANEIAANAIIAGKVAAGAISATEIAAGAITTVKLAAGAVTANEIAAFTIIAGNIASDAITTAKIAAGAVTADEIAANSITAGQIAAGAISTDELAAGAITAVKIATGTITANEIAALTIVAGNIATDAITTVKIAANAVTADEINANAVTAAKIEAGAVAATHISSISLTVLQAQVTTLAALRADLGTITAGLMRHPTNAHGFGLGGPALEAGGYSRYISFNTADYFIKHEKFTLDHSGNAVFSGALSAATGNFSGTLNAGVVSTNALSSLNANIGTITAGQLRNAGNSVGVGVNSIEGSWGHYLNLTGSGYFLYSAVGGDRKFSIDFSGNAFFKGEIQASSGTFAGTVTSTSFTGAGARFTGFTSGYALVVGPSSGSDYELRLNDAGLTIYYNAGGAAVLTMGFVGGGSALNGGITGGQDLTLGCHSTGEIQMYFGGTKTYYFQAGGTAYADTGWSTFSPSPEKAAESMSALDWIAWAHEDASKPVKPYSGVPTAEHDTVKKLAKGRRQKAAKVAEDEINKYAKDVSKIAIGTARWGYKLHEALVDALEAETYEDMRGRLRAALEV